MEHLLTLYNEIQKYIGQTVYRICPKCNEDHNGDCKNCAWRFCQKPCITYGLWGDGNWKAGACQILEVPLTWEWLPDFMAHLGDKTFFTFNEAEARLKRG